MPLAMKTGARLAVVLIAIVAIVGVWWLRSGIPQAARPTSGETIVAFGDSLVAGRGASAGHDFVSLLSERLGVRIVNAGVSGDTTASALARVDRDVLSRNPRIVIVLLGGNDLLRQIPLDQTFTNLGSIVDRVRQRGSAVVLVGVGTGLWVDPYSARYEALAKRTSAVLVPDILDDIMGHGNLMADQIHPNDAGYEIVARRLEPVVRDLMRTE
jgi:lysophospholipase L1-like esterase